jgi:heme/copper-type cytochrome/quinol oxidase subunit 4
LSLSLVLYIHMNDRPSNKENVTTAIFPYYENSYG